MMDSEFDTPIARWLDEYSMRGYMTTDASLSIRGWNRWFEVKSGQNAQALIGRNLFEVFPDLVSRQLNRLYHDALTGQVAVLAHRFHRYLIELPGNPEFGIPVMQQSAIISPLLRDGKVIGTVTVVDDVSERVFRENELLAARDEADKANQAKDRFIAVLSHDLRGPLAAIAAWTQVFKERANDERIVRKGAEVIQRNTALQVALIEQVLDISRIAASKMELNLENVDVQEIVDSTLEAMGPLAQTQEIRIDRVPAPSERRATDLDPRRFQQVIWNLISNALKFTPRGGSVRIALEYRADCFQLSVADTGKGISAENLHRIFEPLWQAEGSLVHGGLGLGLAIVKNIVDLHGGKIRVESPGEGKGAVFSVEIPWIRPAVTRNRPTIHNNLQA